jgi:hypothetical protein
VKHVWTAAATTSAPPHPPKVAASNPAPLWQNLTPNVRKLLIAQLTRMLQQTLPTLNATAAREVADESH